MTKSRGIGRGGRRAGSGRKRGTHNKRIEAEIREAQRLGLQLPLEYLLAVMRDPETEKRRRDFAAVASAPYCHARLHRLTVMPSAAEMSAPELDAAIAAEEARFAALPEFQRFEAAKQTIQHETEQQVPRFARWRQEQWYQYLIEIGQAGLVRLEAKVPALLAVIPAKPSNTRK